MPFYKFEQEDLFFNTIKAYPQNDFFIYDKQIYHNQKIFQTGSFINRVKHIPTGHVSLYELNIDRPSTSLIYPFITKQGSLTSFRTTTTASFNEDFSYGDTMTGKYPLSASLSVDHFAASHDSLFVKTLKNTLNFYRTLSPHYEFASSILGRDFASTAMNVISIPSIFYGSAIKKGTVDLKFLISGTVAAHLQDEKRNGELVQVGPPGSSYSGSTAGVVLYNEGFVLLTGSWDLSTGPSHAENYLGPGNTTPKWIYFGVTGSTSTGTNVPSSSFSMNFSGTNYVSVLTMLAHAKRGDLNHSNNPTYIQYGQAGLLNPGTGSFFYKEDDSLKIKNIVSASYPDPTGSFQKTTYISKIGIYDKDKNLIAVTKVATPIKKTNIRDFTFKMKLDI